jgi:hypothetical protein
MKNVDVITTGQQGSALSSDHGGGYLYAEDVYAYAALERSSEAQRDSSGSAGLYLDGYCYFTVRDSFIGSAGDNAVTMCGGGTLNLINCELQAGSTYENTSVFQAHPMGNNTDRIITVNLEDVKATAATGGLFKLNGRSVDINMTGTIDVTKTNGVLIQSIQMDGGPSFMGGKTLDMAYDLKTNDSVWDLDGATVIGNADIIMEETTAAPATLSVTAVNHSTWTGAVKGKSVMMDISDGSVWTVNGDSQLASLTIDNKSCIAAPEGKEVVMTVDGVETPLAEGTYNGIITLTVK